MVDSSQDGAKHHLIHIKKVDGKLEISETDENRKDSIKGTRISARKNGSYSPADLAKIYGNLMGATSGLGDLRVNFNGKPLKNLKALKAEDKISSTRVVEQRESKGTIDVYESSNPGVYFRGQLFDTDPGRYLSALPTVVKDFVRKLPNGLALDINAPFKQNAGRTGFVHESDWRENAENAAVSGTEVLIRKEFLRNPRTFKVPYDFFYDMRYHKDKKKLPVGWIKDCKNEEALAQALLDAPLDKSGLSMKDIKDKVREYLHKKGVIDNFDNYKTPLPISKIDLSKLKSHFPPMAIKNFEDGINEELSRIAHQQRGSEHDVVDFSGDQTAKDMATKHREKETTLIGMESWTKNAIKNYFNKDIDVLFYDKADASAAHAHKGGTSIAFNLKGGYLDEFEKFRQAIKDHDEDKALNSVMKLLSVISHELTHVEETPGQQTHDLRFFRDQQKKLEDLLNLSQHDLLK